MTSVHFDPIDVITVQLTGRKTWWVAPNRFAPAPLEGWAPSDPVPPIMRIYSEGEPPTEIPGDAVEYALEPGAVLHIPRGYWHQTSSDQDSISLHILLIPPLRLDFLLASLRNPAMRSPRRPSANEDGRPRNSVRSAADSSAACGAVRRSGVHPYLEGVSRDVVDSGR